MSDISMLKRSSIEDMVREGLVKDIFKMEQSYLLLKTIGQKFSDVNIDRLNSFTSLFRTIHYSLQTEAILAAARIYDQPSKIYPTRCLRGLLQFLASKTNELPSIREPYQLALHLKYMGVPEELIICANEGSMIFANVFSQYIDDLLNAPKRIDTISKLKIFRDKVLAHNESTETEIFGPTWGALEDLINISKNVVGVLGWAYFSTAYVIEGDYILTEDANRASHSINSLFEIISKE